MTLHCHARCRRASAPLALLLGLALAPGSAAEAGRASIVLPSLTAAECTRPAAELQDPVDGEQPPAEKLTAWPALEDKDGAQREVAKLRAGNTEEMSASAHAWLAEAGAAVAPLLLDALGKERDEAARGRIAALLDELTGAAHTRLVAEHFEAKAAPLRRWALLCAARYPDSELRTKATSALAAARKARKPEADDIWAAALCATSTGSLDGLADVQARVATDWGKVREAVRIALGGVRGPEATARVLAGMEQGDRGALVAGLRMLAGCGDGSARATLAVHLDSSDNAVRVEAINACRGIVDGDLPLDKLSAFDAIELAKKWKERL